ncbi:MAG: M55 family metallopeptidase [Armatimonadia bacterium]
MRIFMHWDMEGVSGIHRREQVWFWEEGVPQEVASEGQHLLIADINSAAAAALEAGVDELIVCDTHRGGGNILLDQMLQDPRITYLERSRGYQDGKYRWMPGLDETVDGFLVPGHHAMAGTAGAFLPHTCNGDWGDFRINGESVGEMGIEACFAGHWGIPVIFAQGDETACREAEAMFPGITTAAVKRSVDHDTCEGPDLATAHRLTAAKLTEALDRLRAGDCRPFQPALPMHVTLRMASVQKAEAAAGRPGVQRVDEYTVGSQVERHCDITQWITGTGLEMTERA